MEARWSRLGLGCGVALGTAWLLQSGGVAARQAGPAAALAVLLAALPALLWQAAYARGGEAAPLLRVVRYSLLAGLALKGCPWLVLLLVLPPRWAARAGAVLLLPALLVLLGFLGLGALFTRPDNWMPFLPPKLGLAGLAAASGGLFFSLAGFDVVPEGRRAALGLSTLVFASAWAVLTGIVPYSLLDVPQPLQAGLHAAGLGSLEEALQVGYLAALGAVTLAPLQLLQDLQRPRWLGLIAPAVAFLPGPALLAGWGAATVLSLLQVLGGASRRREVDSAAASRARFSRE